MRRTPTVLPTALTLTAGSDGPPEIVDRVVPAEPLAAAAAGLGHANISRAGDTGVVRTLPLYALDEREFARPSVALAAVSVAEGATGPLTERPGGVQVGDRFVPLDDAELRINWSSTLEQADGDPGDRRAQRRRRRRHVPRPDRSRRRHRADTRRPATRAHRPLRGYLGCRRACQRRQHDPVVRLPRPAVDGRPTRSHRRGCCRRDGDVRLASASCRPCSVPSAWRPASSRSSPGGSTPPERCGTSCGRCSRSCWRRLQERCGGTSPRFGIDAGRGVCSPPTSRPKWCASWRIRAVWRRRCPAFEVT